MASQITKAEFQVMDVLWTESPMAAADIAERLAQETGWSLKTCLLYTSPSPRD